jgi:hypothetical protein
MTTSPDTNELLLTAQRYLTGELPPDEHAAFETRLADDLIAQEALADAVELSAAMALTAALPAATRSRLAPGAHRVRRWALGLSGLALGAAAAALGWVSIRPDVAAKSATPSPAQLWAALAAERGDAEEAEDAELSVLAADVPDWMFAAVAAGSSGSVDDQEEAL